ncbi:kinase-like domain-containing protein [Clohesyomyces aquaticus]|uniref:Kinase-like domain-containing protein n=1 Tax=Clohesyomyces aquaticus TaxID=1231657 RepID=A0A1Y1YW50_9PLEO|nr:kinase-like domain-containing protein [Clohesyomyces aquaticus]
MPHWPHNGTEHLAINNTFIRRVLTRLALHTTARFYSRDGLVVPISRHLIVKTGRRVHLTEAATMKFVAENTSIPVPRVYCSFLRKKRAYISLAEEGGEEGLERIFAQLRKMFQELRGLTPPSGTGVESCVRGSLYDSRIPRGCPRFGPFKTIQEFHFWLRHDYKQEDLKEREDDQDSQDLRDMMSIQHGPWPAPVFTHGDFNPFNVKVRDGKVVGIIDWEFAGWYPNYWEYGSAWFGNITCTEWQGLIDKILDRPTTVLPRFSVKFATTARSYGTVSTFSSKSQVGFGLTRSFAVT